MEKTYHQPLGGNKMPRFGGPATMMRLPAVSSAKGLDAAFVGVPFDIGTSNRSGARFGPRQWSQGCRSDHPRILRRPVTTEPGRLTIWRPVPSQFQSSPPRCFE